MALAEEQLNAVYGEFGETHLFRAAHRGDIDLVRTLIGFGADVDKSDTRGLTPSHITNSSMVLRVLIDAGADPTARSVSGKTLLIRHVYHKRCSCVKLLLQNELVRRDIDLDEGKGAALLVACHTKPSAFIAKLLLDWGANPNIFVQGRLLVELLRDEVRHDSSDELKVSCLGLLEKAHAWSEILFRVLEARYIASCLQFPAPFQGRQPQISFPPISAWEHAEHDIEIMTDESLVTLARLMPALLGKRVLGINLEPLPKEIFFSVMVFLLPRWHPARAKLGV
jgi:hypothetical protein